MKSFNEDLKIVYLFSLFWKLYFGEDKFEK